MIRKSIFLASLLSLTVLAFGQGVAVPPSTAFKVVNGITQPFSGATITVCASNTSGIPCSPVLTGALFFDTGLTQPKPNPFQADSNGNYAFAIAPGTYTITITGTGFAGYSYQMTSPGTGSGGGGGGGSTNVFTNGAVLGPLTFATLPASAANGTVAIISDGTAGPVCSAGGAGAIAYRVAGAWTCDSPISGYLGAFTVATLPAASAHTSQLVRVTDGLNSSDCSTGGGSTNVVCMSNGSTWQTVGGGTGLPTAAQAGQVPTSTAAGTSYSAQTKGYFDLKDYGCVADDSTDNATCFSNAAAAVNAYVGTGIPTLFCGMGLGEKAYKSSGAIAFTIPATLRGNCTIDYSGTGDAVTLGPSGLLNFSNAQIPPYTVAGITFIGGASAATGIHVNLYISDTRLDSLTFLNYGHGGATGASCPSWAILEDGGNNETQLIDIFSWNYDGTANRCFFKTIDSTSVGSNTVRAVGLHILATAAPGFSTPCSGTAIYQDGSGGNIAESSVYGYAIPIRIGGLASGTEIWGNNLDTAGCSANGSSAEIQFGDPGSATTTNFINITNNTMVSGAGHATYLVDLAGDTTATSLGSGINIMGNKTVGGTAGTINNAGCTSCNAQFNIHFNTIAAASYAAFSSSGYNFPAGSQAAPSIALGQSSTGWHGGNGNTAIDFSFNGTDAFELGQNYAWVKNAIGYAIGASSNSWLSAPSSGNFTLGTASQSASGGHLTTTSYQVPLTATAALTAGQVVKIDSANSTAVVVTVTTDTAAGIPIGIVINSPALSTTANVVTSGIVTTPVLGTGTCTIGQFVIVDTTTNGRVKCTSTYTAGTIIGYAVTAQAVVGSAVSVMVQLK